MYHRLLIHVVWTTRDRKGTINGDRATHLVEALPIIARQERCRVIAIGVVSTHVHLLLRIHPTTQLPRLIQRMKGGTAHNINRGSAMRPHDLRWAKGYSATSVSPRNALTAIRYVEDQARHHPEEAIEGLGVEIKSSARR